MATRYLRQGASGANNGTDWTNAYTTFAAVTLSRTDVIYVAAGSYTSRSLNTALNGFQTITIQKATVADHGPATDWSDSFASGAAVFSGTMTFSQGYFIFNGVTGGGPGSWSTGHGFEISHTGTAGAGVLFSGTGHQILHVKLTGNNGTSDSNSDSFRSTGTTSNMTVAYCYTNNSGRCAILSSHANSNALWEYNHFGSIQGFGSVHGETASIWGNPVNWTVRYCVMTGIDSTGGFMWDNQSTPSGSLLFYGNVVYDIGSAWGSHGNGALGGWQGSNGEEFHNVKAYNNTFITVSSGTPCLGSLPNIRSGLEARNNLFYSCPSPGGSIWTTSHNHSISSPTLGTNSSTGSGNPFVSLAGFDFRLTSDTPTGTSLPAPFNTDMSGNVRGTGGIWTRGAMQFVTSGDTTPPAAPTGVTVS